MMVSTKAQQLSRKISKSVRRRLLARLPWGNKYDNNNSKASDSYRALPPCDAHQEEQDENALNEALERRLMELIASSPQQQDHKRLAVKQVQQVSVPANPDLLAFAGSFVCLMQVQTRCQDAQPQAQ